MSTGIRYNTHGGEVLQDRATAGTAGMAGVEIEIGNNNTQKVSTRQGH